MTTAITIYLHKPDAQSYGDLMRAAIRSDRRLNADQPLAREARFIPDERGKDACYTPEMTNKRGGADCSSLVRAEAGAPTSGPGYTHVGILKDPNSADGYHAFLIYWPGMKGKHLVNPPLVQTNIKDPSVERGLRPAPTLEQYRSATFVSIWNENEKIPRATGTDIARAESNYFRGKDRHPHIAVIGRGVSKLPPAQALDTMREGLRVARLRVKNKTATPEQVSATESLAAMTAALQALMARDQQAVSEQISTAKSAIDAESAESPLGEKVLLAYQKLAETFPDLLKAVIGTTTATAGDAGEDLNTYLGDSFMSQLVDFAPPGTFGAGGFFPADIASPFGALNGLEGIQRQIPPGCGGSCSISAGWE